MQTHKKCINLVTIRILLNFKYRFDIKNMNLQGYIQKCKQNVFFLEKPLIFP